MEQVQWNTTVEKAITKSDSESNIITELLKFAMTFFIVSVSLLSIWAFSCLVGGLFVTAGRVLKGFLTV
jgi:hypothetical protein